MIQEDLDFLIMVIVNDNNPRATLAAAMDQVMGEPLKLVLEIILSLAPTMI